RPNPRGPMSHEVGRTLPLSLPRRFVGDLLHFARQVPTVPVQRRVDVAALRQARAQACPAVSWPALFLKAYGRVAEQVPELRRAYLGFPYARLYEHPFS